MTREETEARIAALEADREALEHDMGSIRSQIDHANARVSEGGSADQVWLARAKAALRYKGSAHQKLLRELGEARRSLKVMTHEQVRAASAAPFSRYFYQVAAHDLPEDVFQAIYEKAHAMREQAA